MFSAFPFLMLYLMYETIRTSAAVNYWDVVVLGLPIFFALHWLFYKASEAFSVVYFVTNERAGKTFRWPVYRVWSAPQKLTAIALLESQFLQAGDIRLTQSDYYLHFNGARFEDLGFIGVRKFKETANEIQLVLDFTQGVKS